MAAPDLHCIDPRIKEFLDTLAEIIASDIMRNDSICADVNTGTPASPDIETPLQGTEDQPQILGGT